MTALRQVRRPDGKPVNRILVTADVHIYLYLTFSVLDPHGFPSRLNDFVVLADDMVSIAKAKKADAIAVVGDLLHSPTNSPAVLWVAKKFIEILAESGLPVILSNGNHDMDTKVESNDEGHSIITPLLGQHPNIFYVPNEAMLDLGNDKTAYVKSWTRSQYEHEGEFPEADLFFGHDLVKNTTDPYGHRFTHGFNSEVLLNKYTISVVGDIHKHHLIRANKQNTGNFLLIPGQPLQTNFSSGGDNHLWVIDLKKVTVEGVGIDAYPSKHPYHRFILEPAPTEDMGGLTEALPTHYHYRNPPKVKPAAGEAPETRVELSTVNLLDAVFEQQPNWDHQLLITECFDKVKGVQSSTVPESVITSVEGRDFLSIDHLKIDLTNVGPTVMIHGENGSGKTTLMEMIYWAITGKLTKPMPVDEVSNNVTGRKAEVTLHLTIEGQPYRIVRTRGKQILSLWLGDKELTKGRAPDTQALIYGLLGLTDADILTLVYFSLNGLTTFSNLTSSQKYEFLGKIANYDRLTAFRDSLSDQQDAQVQLLNRADGKLSGIREQLDDSQRAIDTWSSGEDDRPEQVDVAKLSENIEKLEKALKPGEAELTTARDALAAANVRLERNDGKMKRVMADIKATKDKIVQLKDAKCPECGQTVHDDTLLKKYKEKLAEQANDLRELTTAIRTDTDTAATARDRRDALIKVEEFNQAVRDRISTINAQIREATRVPSEVVPLNVLEKQYEELLKREKLALTERDLLLSVTAELKAAIKYTAKNGPVATKLSESVCVALETKVNELVADANACSVRVIAGKDIDVYAAYRGNRPVHLTAASGGERRLVDVLILIALNSLYSDYYGLPAGILGLSCYDEVLSNLDQLNTELCVGALEASTSGLKMVITHDDKAKPFFPNRIEVTKVKGVSQYQFED